MKSHNLYFLDSKFSFLRDFVLCFILLVKTILIQSWVRVAFLVNNWLTDTTCTENCPAGLFYLFFLFFYITFYMAFSLLHSLCYSYLLTEVFLDGRVFFLVLFSVSYPSFSCTIRQPNTRIGQLIVQHKTKTQLWVN